MASSRSSRRCCGWVRTVVISRIRAVPSSVAFSTANSSADFFTVASSSSTSGGAIWSRTRASARSTTPFFSTSATVARHSPSRPLKSRRSSPAPSRITWVR